MIVHVLFTPALNKSYETACPEIENKTESPQAESEREPNATW
jgi:hypothetical protein